MQMCIIYTDCKKNAKTRCVLNKIVIFALHLVQDILCPAVSIK